MHAAHTAVDPPQRLAGYHLRRCLGSGPTGTVYSAVHPISGHKVAVKLIALDQDRDYGSSRWLERVGERLAAWRHPGVVPVLKVGRHASTLFVISEYARGRSLAQLLAQSGLLSEANVRPLLEALAVVLASAHRQGLVHGGLSLENVWLTPREAGSWPPLLRVMDFGLALLRPPEALGQPQLGCFVAPELRAGDSPSPAADSYSWGAVAYRLLCGHLPWETTDPEEVWQLQQQGTAIPPSVWATLTPQTEALVLRALHPKPEKRPAADALVAALADLPAPALAPNGPPPLPAAALAQRLTKPVPQSSPPVTSISPAASSALCHADCSPGPGLMTPQRRSRPTARVTRVAGPPASSRSRPGGRLVWGALSGLLVAALLISGGLRLGLGLWPWALAAPPPPQTARLTVISDPSGATLFIDGQRQAGTTPFTLKGIPQGQPYEVLVHHPGYHPWQQRVALGLGETERLLQATLAKEPPRWGSLVLHLDVTADVFLDGRRVGAQTRQLTLAEVRAGIQHQLRVTAPGGRFVEQTVEVSAGKVTVLHFTLASEASARHGT